MSRAVKSISSQNFEDNFEKLSTAASAAEASQYLSRNLSQYEKTSVEEVITVLKLLQGHAADGHYNHLIKKLEDKNINVQRTALHDFDLFVSVLKNAPAIRRRIYAK